MIYASHFVKFKDILKKKIEPPPRPMLKHHKYTCTLLIHTLECCNCDFMARGGSKKMRLPDRDRGGGWLTNEEEEVVQKRCIIQKVMVGAHS